MRQPRDRFRDRARESAHSHQAIHRLSRPLKGDTRAYTRDDLTGAPLWKLADQCLNSGECLYDPELHDGPDDPASETVEERAAREHVAAEVCATCPVRAACREYARRTRPDHGIWAGLTSAEIAALADAPRTERRAA